MSKIDLSLVKKLVEKGLIKKGTLARVEKQIQKGIINDISEIEGAKGFLEGVNKENQNLVDGFMARFGDDPDQLVRVKKALDQASLSKNPYENLGDLIAGIPTTFNKNFKITEPMQEIGAKGISEPFNSKNIEAIPWMDQKYGVTKGALKEAKGRNNPVVINTSSDLIANDDYIDALPQGSKVRIYGLTNDDKINRTLFPGSPSNLRLQKAYERLKASGVDVEFVQPTADDVIAALKNKTKNPDKRLQFGNQGLDPSNTDDFLNKTFETKGGEAEFREMLKAQNAVKRNDLKLLKAAAPMGAMSMSDINPMQFLQPAAQAYNAGKEKLISGLSNQMDLTKDKSASSDIEQVLGAASIPLDPLNLIPGAPGLGLSAIEGMASMSPKTKFDPQTLQGLYKGGMIKEDTYQRAMKYAEGGMVAEKDPLLQDKINSAIDNTMVQAQGLDTEGLPEKNYDPSGPYGGQLAKSLGVPGYEFAQGIVPERGFLGDSVPVNPNTLINTQSLDQGMSRGAASNLPPPPDKYETAPAMSQGAQSADQQQQLYSPQMMAMPSQADLGNISQPSFNAFDEMKNKIEESAKADEARSFERQRALAEQNNKLSQMQENYMKQAAIDPNRFWNSRSTGQKIAAGIAIFLGGLGRGNTQNRALDEVNNAINRDIDSQKEQAQRGLQNIQMQGNVYANMMKQFENEAQATAATRQTLLQVAGLELNRIGAMTSNAVAQKQLAIAQGQLNVELMKANKEFQQASLLYGAGSKADEMTRKIMTQIPKDYREKAIQESGKVRQLEVTLKNVDKYMNEAFEASTVGEKIDVLGVGSKAKIKSQLIPKLQVEAKKVLGDALSEGEFERMVTPFEPSVTDSKKELEFKKQGLKDLIATKFADQTPILDAFGIGRKKFNFTPERK